MERDDAHDNGNESTGDTIMAKGVSIDYGDVAPEAKENFNIEVSEKKFDTLGNLQKYNMQLYNYANPCELYQTVLDGTAVALPSDPTTANIGLWSEQLSNDDGTFETPITVTLTSEGQYSSQGFTLTFDKFNEIYPTKLTIQWFRVTSEGIEDLSGEVEFNPTSGTYFCRNQVENFNKVVIKFYALNMPKNRLKLEVIDYGYGTVFYGDKLRNVKITQSIDPISSEIKINTCDFTLDSHTDMIYSFQTRQPLSVRFNDVLLATMFVKTSKRTAKFLWDINSEDYISLMNNVSYVGGIYTDKNAGELLEDIFAVAKVPYYIADELYNMTLSGYIPYTTCREALMQVCFASLSVVNTANTDVVEVKKLEDDVKQSIPLARIMQGQNFDNADTVTGVELTAHTYSPSSETTEIYTAEDSGTGENILVKFSEPMHTLKIGYINSNDKFIADASYGDIISYGSNYAYINANENCVLQGRSYKHIQTVRNLKNPVVLASETENIMSITDATLVSADNVDKVLNNAYNWLTKVDSTNLKIVIGKDVKRETHTVKWGELPWGKFKWGQTIINETVTDQEDVNLGEVIEAETEYLGNVSGRLIQQSFNLNGNIVVKECVIK